MRRLTILLAILVACGTTARGERAVGCGWTPDPEIHGAHLDAEDCQAAWCHAPDLKAHIRDTIEHAASYWHTDNEVLYGWKIRLVDGHVSCYGFDGQWGCTDWLKLTITITSGLNFSSDSGSRHCVETTELVHEVGHVILPGGDPTHIDSGFHGDGIHHTQEELVQPLDYSVVRPCLNRQALADYACYGDIHGDIPFLSPSSCGW